VCNHAFLSASISGIAEYACIAIAQHHHAINTVHIISPVGCVMINPSNPGIIYKILNNQSSIGFDLALIGGQE
jgi:hypothetical protein